MILMSVEELAEYLGESKRTIYRYIKTGDCPPYIRITKKNIKFDKKDVDAWLESKKINPSVEESMKFLNFIWPSISSCSALFLSVISLIIPRMAGLSLYLIT